MTRRKFGIPWSISKTTEVKDFMFGAQHHCGPSHKSEVQFSERELGLGQVTPGKFGLSWIISPKPVKLETSLLRHVPSHKTDVKLI